MNKCIFLLLCITTISADARDYFVAPGGNNGNNGSIGSPLATIQFALNQCLPGDTVQVRGGTYFEKITCTRSGTFSQHITLKNYAAETAIIDGTGRAGLSLLELSNVSHIEIRGLIFQNNYIQDARGIYAAGQGDNLAIRNCTVKNIGWTTNPDADPFSVSPNGQAHAVLFNGRTAAGITRVKLLNSNIHDIITGNSEALTLAGNVDGFEIDRDTVWNTKNIGIVAAGYYSWAVDAGVPASQNQSRNGTITNCVVYNNRRFSNTYAPAGIYVDGGKNIQVTGNKVFRNGNGISLGCENTGAVARDITVANNLVFDNDNHGMVLGANNGLLKNAVIVNNTFFQDGSVQVFTLEINLQKSDSCTIANNILIPRTDSHYGIGVFGYTLTNLVVDQNLLYRYSSNATFLYVPGSPAQFTPTNTLTADPLFAAATLPAPDLHITSASPAINAGSNAYPMPVDTDADQQYRFVNGTIDLGACERQDGGCPAVFTITDAHQLRGKFAASQKIVLNRSQPASITQPVLWSSPLVELLSPLTVSSGVTVRAAGCN